MSERSPIDRVVFGPVAAVRPWLFGKALYLLLALDVWHTLVGPAWRYGAAGFNVAHFGLLDALPIPTREAYIGMLVLVGAMGFVAAALPRTPRALSITITVLYTWGWSCSMLDSYQHHYLITVLLTATCFFPQLSAVDLFGRVDAVSPSPPPKPTKKKSAPAPIVEVFPHGLVARIRSLGWTLVTSFAGVVYAFTAISKAEPEWRSGEALRNITNDGATMRAPLVFAAELGFDADAVFAIMGSGMIVVQIVCALGYLTASLRDGPPIAEDEMRTFDARWRDMDVMRITLAFAVWTMVSVALGVAFDGGAAFLLFVVVAAVVSFRWLRFVVWPTRRPRVLSFVASLALVLALSFHLGAEYIGLQIGWFSYYMIVLAVIALAPAHWLAFAAAIVTLPVRGTNGSLFDRAPLLAPIFGLLAAGAAAYAGVTIDLPGAYDTAIAVGLVALALGVGAMMRPALRPELGRAAAALGVAMIVCCISMTQGMERYDFYRFAGGDFRRRHEYPQALDAYREANRYAPEGESREDRVREMEAAIRDHTP